MCHRPRVVLVARCRSGVHNRASCTAWRFVIIPTRGLADSLGLPKSSRVRIDGGEGRFAMRPGLTLREDYDAARLRGLARRTKSAAQGRRLLALAEIYDGGPRTKAACVGGVGLQTIRDWVLRFNAHGPDGLADRQAPGHPGKLNTAQREALAAMVESGPTPHVHRPPPLGKWVLISASWYK